MQINIPCLLFTIGYILTFQVAAYIVIWNIAREHYVKKFHELIKRTESEAAAATPSIPGFLVGVYDLSDRITAALFNERRKHN